ncbi:hypothetical protein ASG52_22645 [Methylobacterium sp. Leaf456]|uniref:AAA family ATPase n=1 Tax=Methylobacterium sp. Leaf456 TaxID=1736382 RepID=UPI0006F819C4|nr:MoxR family ATPase [Methylobacterium sp. Leaf456]KQT58249.1 hypothetical protein ASG52_22645 [Methylobacterium sp. Leaf456]
MSEFDLLGRLAQPGISEAARASVLADRQQRVTALTQTAEQSAVGYVAGASLRTAINVALSLGRPLLLTGEPGSGKTLAAYWLANLLGCGPKLFHKVQVRSDSRARDLRYDFDAVSWFRASQLAPEMGKGREVAKEDFLHPRALGAAFGWAGPVTTPHLVLIDEIDKAPRDFPNDLLLELDQMRFSVEETGTTVGPPSCRPIIVVTSNAERRLPDPFLRRCVVHRIEMPPAVVTEILKTRLVEFGGGDPAFLEAASNFWVGLENKELQRKPTIAEYWQWLALELRHGVKSAARLQDILLDGRLLPTATFARTLFGPADLAKLQPARP